MYKVIIFLSVMILLMVGCNKEEDAEKLVVQHYSINKDSEETNELDTVDVVEKQVIYNGLDVFNRTCTACHENIQIVASNLPKGTNSEQIVSIISNGFENMPPFNSILKKEEVEAVAEEILKISANN